MRFVVYTEIFNENGMSRWYYGVYSSQDRANEVAMEITDRSARIFGNIVEESEAESWHINNLRNNGIFY